MFRPKILTTLREYSPELFFKDLVAGIIVGIVALPLAIAFGIASGVSPEKGLVTAVVAGFLISALGGSRVQIGGPTGAFVVIVYGIVHKYGVDGLTLATLMAGVLLIVFGLARFGQVIKFVPRSVTVGFTSGIAVIIFSSQVRDFLGLAMDRVPPDFMDKWRAYFEVVSTANFSAAGIALGTVLLIIAWKKVPAFISSKVPASLVALILSSAAVSLWALPVETIGSRFGELPRALPMPRWPAMNWDLFQTLLQPAMTIALLGAIESLLSAVVADGMIGTKHRSNTELIAQGIANIGSSLFGGIPATGAIARTATNVRSGGRTPIAGIIHAVTLLLLLLLFAPLAKRVPLACLAGILTVVAYHMSEWRSFISLLKGPREDKIVLCMTFFLTISVDLTVAIEVGMVLAAFLFMYRMSEETKVRFLGSEGSEMEDNEDTFSLPPKDVEIYEIRGPLFFGVAQEFEETMRLFRKKPKVQIIKMDHVPVIDATGLHVLETLHKDCRKRGIELVLGGVRESVFEIMKTGELVNVFGVKNIVDDHAKALERASEIISGSP